MSSIEIRIQDYANNGFSAVFIIEMIIKLLGYGIIGYVRDKANIFDWIIVVISIADTTISATLSYDVQASGAISAFRIFRLFRVIKLAKGWKKFQELIKTIVNSFKDVSNFSVLLFLFIFVYTLLGRELFAYNLKFDSNGNLSSESNAQSPRSNFDTFGEAIVTIFIVLTGEQWNIIMYNWVRYQKYPSLAFFISLIMIGQMILLNLFLAILLENFNISEKGIEDKSKHNSLMRRIDHYINHNAKWINK